jgi:ribonuclease Z
MDLDVLFLGTAASAPTARRGLPATLIRRGGERLLVDCGEGTQRQMVRSAGLVDIDEVFITHFHADHVLGLPGMLKTYGLQARERTLRVNGPRGLERLFGVLDPLIGRLPFRLELTEMDPGDELERDGYRMAAFAVEHGVRALGYALIEDERPGRFDEARARELGVQPGPDFGRLQQGETVGEVTPDQVLGEARRGRAIVLTGDTAPCEMTEAVAHGADLLVHEATFMAEDAERAAATGHATALGAAELAAAAGVKLLALTHVSARYPASALRDEARTAFEATVVPRDFDRIEIPLPERGGPEHVRGEEP